MTAASREIRIRFLPGLNQQAVRREADDGRSPRSSFDLALDDGRLAPGAEAAPARPENQRHQNPDDPDNEQDHADGVDIDPRDAGRYRPGQDRAGRDQNQTYANAHPGS